MAWLNGYNWRRTITVNGGQVTGTQTNFPMLISCTNADMATIGNGGAVLHVVNQIVGARTLSVPADMIFTSDAAGSVLLNWEFETYVAATGATNIWINVPSIATGTAIYMFYGNGSVTTLQCTPSSTWNSGYYAVYHLPDGSSLDVSDSTVNGNTGTNHSATAGTGQIDGGAAVVKASSQFITTGITMGRATTPNFLSGTVSGWFNPTNAFNDNASTAVCGQMDSGQGEEFCLQKNGSNNVSAGWRTSGGGDKRVVVAASSSNWAQNAWNHWALTWVDGGTTTLYVSGVSVGTTSGVYVTNAPGANSFQMSGEPTVSNYVNGVIDQFEISTTNLSANWILAEYMNQFAPNTFSTISSAASFGSSGVIFVAECAPVIIRFQDYPIL